MGATDNILARYTAEIEEHQKFIDGLVEAAENASEKRDLTPQEMELVTRKRDRIAEVNKLMQPLEEARRISGESSERIAELAKHMAEKPEEPKEVKYRSAGAYVLDYWRAGLGVDESIKRLKTFNRAAAHQLTTDNPGLLPEQILGPVINFVDDARPLVTALGPRQLPSGSWSRPRVTQHTNVAEQTAEKTELVSRKMTITKVPVAADTYGGYVNISRQDIDWTQPQIMDIVIDDLASMYASVTEAAAATAIDGAATPSTPALPAAPTSADVAKAIWAAAGAVYAAMKGAGRLLVVCSPDMLGLIGPLFAPVNPTNAQSTGFSAGGFGSGAVGAISGIGVVMSPGLPAGTIDVLSTAAAEVYEDRIGSLQVVEPSVLGVQVAYAGYFSTLVLEPQGIKSIAVGP